MAKFGEALVNAMANECGGSDGKYQKMICDTEGAYKASFSDKECKTQVDADKKEDFKAWGCDGEGRYITGASTFQVALASLTLGALSYMN